MAAPTTGRQRYQWGLLLLAAVLLVAWLLVDGGGQADPSGRATDSSTTSSSSPSSTTAVGPSGSETTDDTGGDGGTDPESGLPIVQVSDLPPEAAETLDLIDAGGPFPEPDRDGSTFENREDLLPDHPMGYYKEYTVPTPGRDDRGARRIVAGEGGELYYTDDHYRSFSRIAR
jgi:ribonuclease T1